MMLQPGLGGLFCCVGLLHWPVDKQDLGKFGGSHAELLSERTSSWSLGEEFLFG